MRTVIPHDHVCVDCGMGWACQAPEFQPCSNKALAGKPEWWCDPCASLWLTDHPQQHAKRNAESSRG